MIWCEVEKAIVREKLRKIVGEHVRLNVSEVKSVTKLTYGKGYE